MGPDLSQTEIDQRRCAEDLLLAITEGTAAVTGGDFFRSLMRHLAAAFQVRYAFITECTDKTMTRLRTLALLRDEDFTDNIEYDVAGTPCEDVVDGSVRYYPQKLRERFPKTTMESYLGVPLYASGGDVLGHIAVGDDKPMRCETADISILKIFAARAGVELERKRAEEALRESERQLRHLNEQLEDYNRNLEQKVTERTREIERRRQVAERLRDLLTILNSNRSLDEILDYIVVEGGTLLGTQSGAIYRLQPDQAAFALQAWCGLPDALVEYHSFPVGRSFLGVAVAQRQPVIISDLTEAARDAIGLSPRWCELLTQHYRTLVAVPLVRQGTSDHRSETYGCIALYYPHVRQFSDEEIGLVVAFAYQAALAIENAELRQRARHAAVVEERGRLARELHDSVTQSLYSLTLLAEGWRRLSSAGRLENATDPLAELGAIGQQALKEMRLLVHELRPPVLEQEGLLGALHQRLGAVERRAGIDARLLADDVIVLPAPVEEELYRIAQEALNNALKHASATTVTVHLYHDAQSVMLEIRDNGTGFDAATVQNKGGIGLNSMRERATKLGGVLDIGDGAGGGSSVRVTIPWG